MDDLFIQQIFIDYLLSTVLEARKRKACSCPQGTRDPVEEMDAGEKIVR